MLSLATLVHNFEDGIINVPTLMWHMGGLDAEPGAMTWEQKLAGSEILNWVAACKEARMATRDESDRHAIGFTIQQRTAINAAWKTLGGTVEFTSVEFLD